MDLGRGAACRAESSGKEMQPTFKFQTEKVQASLRGGLVQDTSGHWVGQWQLQGLAEVREDELVKLLGPVTRDLRWQEPEEVYKVSLDADSQDVCDHL